MIRPGSALIFFYIFFNSHALWSQELDIRMYTSLDGLTDNAIFSFYQDQFGYLWLGTGKGLDRFDGTRFIKYGMRDGLPSLICTQLFEDKAGRMWVGTRRGIAEFRKDSFYVYDNVDQSQITYVFQVYENAGGQLIANTLEGQHTFNGTQWEPYSCVKLQTNEVVKTTILTHEGEYFNTGYELLYRNKSGNVKSLWRHPGESPYFRSLQYFNNQLFVNTPSAIYKIDSVHHEQLFPDALNGKFIYNSLNDSYGRWWISTEEDGILVLDERDGYIRKQQIPFEYGFSANFYEDDDHQIWISSPNGAMKVLSSAFSTVEIHEVEKGKHIMNLIPYGDNQFLVSINDGQLLLIMFDMEFPSSYQVLDRYTLAGKLDFIDQYAIGQNGEIWLITRGKQLYLLRNGNLENKTHLVKEAGQQVALDIACDPVSGRIVLSMDSLLSIGNEQRLDTLFDASRSFITYPAHVMIMKGDTLVFHNPEGEVFLYGLQAETKNSFSKLQSPSSGNLKMKLDSRKHLWIYNSGKNLTCFSNSGTSGIMPTDVIDETADNINTLFYANNFDQDGSLWCVTNIGLQQIYKDKKKQWQSREFVIYEISHAAYTDWFKVVESGNQIWVSLRNQLLYFERNIPDIAEKSGNVILEDVQLQNQTTYWNKYTDSLYSYFQTPSDLQLKHHENTLTFFYNSPTTLEDQGTMYSYRLFPSDTMWSKPSENKSVSFSKLQPAHYSFEVRSRNRGMEWGDNTSFSFVIQKPFWDTTWFRILFLLLVSGLVARIFRNRLKQERARGETKSQLLELEMRALRAQMNPHFIYNALNSIQSLVATNQTASANKYISKFARLLRQVLENSKRSEITLNQELESLRLYVDLEKLRLDEEVSFIENINGTVVPETIRIPPLILQPFVENALWHGLSAKEGEKKIELTITADQQWVHFTITDNGIGRKKAATIKSKMTQHESTALQITEQRLRDFNRSMNGDPLIIDDLFSSDGAPAGTRIRLHIRKKQIPG